MLRVGAGENVPPSVFALNGQNEVEEIQLEVVAGPEAIPHAGLQRAFRRRLCVRNCRTRAGFPGAVSSAAVTLTGCPVPWFPLPT